MILLGGRKRAKIRDEGNFLKYYVNLLRIYWAFNLFSRPITVVSGPLIPILPYVAIKLCDF